MKICYIPPKEQKQNNNLIYVAAGASFTDKITSGMETAMNNAIDNCIVKPFHAWCYNMWCGFVDISLPACTITSLTALMLYMVGVKKARQWIIIPIIVYLFISVADAMINGRL